MVISGGKTTINYSTTIINPSRHFPNELLNGLVSEREQANLLNKTCNEAGNYSGHKTLARIER